MFRGKPCHHSLSSSLLFLIAFGLCFSSCFSSETTSTLPAFNPSSNGNDEGSPDDIVSEGGADINADGSFNYAAALQKALFFYDAERSGDLPEDFRIAWRGDSDLCDSAVALDVDSTNLSATFIHDHKADLDPDGNNTLDLSGGFHDAGDHVKFGLPQSYTASTLAWAFYEYEDAFRNSSQHTEITSILKWFADYFLRSTFTNAEGEVIAFAYQVGDGSIDHNYWGPPELQSCTTYPRPATFATAETPASDQVAGAAAALALIAMNFESIDNDYATTCLNTAKSLYEFAKQHRGLGDSGGFYSSSNDNDEMAWAALWLSIATEQDEYLQDITAKTDGNYTGYLSAIIHSEADGWQNIWTHSWDTIWTGVILKLADVTGETFYKDIAKWNLEYWSLTPHDNATDNTFINTSPAGYSFLTIWGSARYNTTAQFMALLYQKYFADDRFAAWAKTQMNYLMGDNPNHKSYIVGYTETSVQFPHHRAAHASFTNSMDDPYYPRHILYGALAGGPDEQDEHIDETSNYIYNEVAIDYNAGFVGALAGHYLNAGGSDAALADFPPIEYDSEPVYIEAKLEQDNSQRTQLTLELHNESLFPPRTRNHLTARYFFSIAELLDFGQDISDVSVEIYYDESDSVYGFPTQVSDPIHWQDEIYYVELDWHDAEIFGKREIQIGLIVEAGSDYTTHWDSANDPSFQDLSYTSYRTNKISAHENDTKVFGIEP